MKCPKCGYHSFDHLDSCKKCNTDLSEHKTKFNLRGFFFPGQATAAPQVEADEEVTGVIEQPVEDAGEFGFDFLEEEESPSDEPSEDISFDVDQQDININQPFGVDSETVPADTPADDNKDKPSKGTEFAF